MLSTSTRSRWLILLNAQVVFILVMVSLARAQDYNRSQPTGDQATTEPTERERPNRRDYDPPVDYDDEPPLDYRERVWRYRTRLWRPQRFAGRDSHTRFGHSPPHHYYPGGHRGFHHGRFRSRRHGGYFPGTEAYLQGRHDERRFRQWKEGHDRGIRTYVGAMQEGIKAFRHAEYSQALRHFLLAARQNQGDPAARLHGMYAMVALGKYDDAVLMMRRAIQLQTRLLELPLDIRDEYGPKVDFDAHLTRLRRYVHDNDGDAGLWMLLGFYQHFSGDAAGADKSLRRASQLAPSDPLIEMFAQTTRLLAPAE